ncbi:hypothetical protein QR680_002761 [Steinernema hermaphroditum]|uniref:C2H2-type domain-containing protein n=1 Tax=Steinernema hermaphroditum TaxID=289476 RepID=A0AA39H5R8_9BILA|nr:hypothetical protein QR680_002761 [Steinernema hermaphroditum]
MDLPSSPSNDSLGEDASIYNYSFAPLRDPELLLADYANEFFIAAKGKNAKKREEVKKKRSGRLRAKSLVKKPDVFGVEDEESSNEDPKQQSTPREDARTITRINKSREAQEANDRADVRDKKERVKDSRKVQVSSDQAIFYYFHERKRSDILDAIFDAETRQEYVNKVKEVRCERPSIMRMYAHWRRIELMKTIKKGMEIWKCQVCKEEKKAKGALMLLTHIGTHEGISYACIVEGCGSFLKLCSFRDHLRKTHGVRVDQLEQQQYHKLRLMEKSFYIEARTKMNNYFPPEAFLRFDRNVSKKAQFEDPNCRECGLVVSSITTRRSHVAQHLKLSYKCVVDGCDIRTDATNMGRHLRWRHSKKVAQLTAEELFERKRIRTDFHNVMQTELSKFFPYREDID